MTLSPDERLRYKRHLLLPKIGETGQLRLKSARVAIIGLGGLGSPVSLYLAAAGVGTIGLVDADKVDASNLQRQILYTNKNIGIEKLEAATQRLRDLNPNVTVIPHTEMVEADNAMHLIADYDIVIDGTDNFTSHYLLNDACVLANKTLVYASVERFSGHVGVVLPKQGPCYRCLYPEPPPPELALSCAEAGVLGVVPGLVGMLQATEALKLILGIGEPLTNHVLRLDALTSEFRKIKLTREASCLVCGDHPSITTLTATAPVCTTLTEINTAALKAALQTQNPPFVLDVRQPEEKAEGFIADAVMIALPDLPQRLNELSDIRNRDIVVYCRSGKRSAQAVRLLQEAGFTKTYSLTGGIQAYNAELDAV